jgi:hypothetical protein
MIKAKKPLNHRTNDFDMTTQQKREPGREEKTLVMSGVREPKALGVIMDLVIVEIAFFGSRGSDCDFLMIGSFWTLRHGCGDIMCCCYSQITIISRHPSEHEVC